MKRSTAVKMFEDTVTLEVWSPIEDVHPDIFQKLRRWAVSYPYPRNERVGQTSAPRDYRALILENEYLKVTVLPELGGHLYAAYDKINNRHVFHHMRKLFPRPLGRRGAWAPLGVEFNFPSSHSPTSLSEIDGVLRDNGDGSASIIIADVERVSRMAWSMDITLRPGVNAIEMTTTLINRTPDVQGYYWWTNAAIPAADTTRLIIPITSTSGHGLPGSGEDWPIRHGVDYSLHRNIRHTMGVFGHGCREDFMGAYDEAADCGVAHVADYRMLPGKKFFTWGMGPGGLRKSSEYSPGDGCYAELQAGLFEHQPTYDLIRAHSTVRFDSTFLPVAGLGGPFTRANEVAAVALRLVDARTVHLAACVASDFGRCRIVLTRRGKTVFKTTRVLSPEKPFSDVVNLKSACRKASDLELTVTSADGNEVIREHPNGAEGEAEEGWLDAPANGGRRSRRRKPEGLTVEQEYLRALGLQKMGLLFAAREGYEAVLLRDEGHALTRLQLGRLMLYAGRYEDAIDQFKGALARDDQLFDAHYYTSLARAAMGDDTRAADGFWILLRTSETDARALIQLGSVAMRRGDFCEASEFFTSASAINPDDTLAAGLLSAALRHQGSPEYALSCTETPFEHFGADHLLACERALAAVGTDKRDAEDYFERMMGRNIEGWLELAVDYVNVGLFDDALAVLQAAIKKTRTGKQVYPMLHYWTGFVLERLGRKAQAKRAYLAGGRMKPDRVFPGRTESIDVLRRVLAVSPDDTTALFALGNILYHRTERTEACALWRRAHSLNGSLPVVLSNLAIAAWEANDLKRTAHYLHKATRQSPDNMRLILWLDHVLAEARQDRKRLALLGDAFRNHPDNDDIREHLASLLLDMRKPRKALELVAGHTFRTRHGVVSLTRLHMNAHTQLGLTAFKQRNWERALKEFEEARSIPIRLGEDEGRYNIFGKSLYYAGQCLEKLGRDSEARKRYRMCVKEHRHWLPELRYYDCLSYRRLGKPKLAREALADLGKAVERCESSRNIRTAYVHYLRALYLRAQGHAADADREDKLAQRHGWRASDEVELKFRFGFS